MNSKKQLAIKLRRRGLSYSEINKRLGIAKSTLSSWLGDMVIIEKVQNRLNARMGRGTKNLIKRNKLQTNLAKVRAGEIEEKASKEISRFSKKDLMLAGIILYWAEGYKRLKVVNGVERTHHPIFFTNSDPMAIKSFVIFLEEVMNIPRDKIGVNLRLFKFMNGDKEIRYWSKISGVGKSQFDKPVFIESKSSKGIRPYNRLAHGVAQIRVLNTNEFHRLVGWIEGVKKNLINYQKKL